MSAASSSVESVSAKPTLFERAMQFCAESDIKYQRALDLVDDAVSMSACDHWLRNYAGQVEMHRQTRERYAARIVELGTYLTTAESDEDTEKDIKDAVKAIAEERIANTAWWNRAVSPLVKTVTTCDAIRDELVAKARQTDRDMQLIDKGLAAEVEKIVATWRKPTWDQASGRVFPQS